MKRATHFCLVGLFVLVLGVAGCKPVEVKPLDKTALDAQKRAEEKAAEAQRPTDIGDAEASIKLELQMVDPAVPNVKAEELRDERKDELNLLTLTVSPPAPPQLNMVLVANVTKSLKTTPVLMRITILRNDSEVQKVSAVVGPQTGKRAFTHIFDAFAGLPGPVDSLLIHAKAELVLLPPGTDPATVDPNAVAATPEGTGTVLSNPVRVDFVAEAPAA